MGLDTKMTALADAIRSKSGTTDKLSIDEMTEEVLALEVAGGDEEVVMPENGIVLYVTLYDPYLEPCVGVCPNGTVTIDWGDGTTPDTIEGSSVTTRVDSPVHKYEKAGNYIIVIECKEGSKIGLRGYNGGTSSGTGYLFFSGSTSGGVAYHNNYYNSCVNKILFFGEITIGNSSFYCSKVRSIEFPQNAIFGGYDYMFNENTALISLKLPNNMDKIGSNFCYSCRSLTDITLPSGITSIDYSAFTQCYGLSKMVIPKSVMSIGNSAFSYCSGMRYYDFTSHESVPTLSATGAFSGIPSDCEIRVPAALYDEWISATNWSTYANKIVAV